MPGIDKKVDELRWLFTDKLLIAMNPQIIQTRTVHKYHQIKPPILTQMSLIKSKKKVLVQKLTFFYLK